MSENSWDCAHRDIRRAHTIVQEDSSWTNWQTAHLYLCLIEEYNRKGGQTPVCIICVTIILTHEERDWVRYTAMVLQRFVLSENPERIYWRALASHLLTYFGS